MKLGERIKSLRLEKDITQDKFSEIFQISKSNVSKYENDIIEPNNELLLKIASYFNVSLDYLLGNSDIRNPYKPASTELNKKDIKEIDKYMEKVEKDLTNEAMMFDGEPFDKESIQLVLDSMRVGVEIAKKRNKEKYTPKKYRK